MRFITLLTLTLFAGAASAQEKAPAPQPKAVSKPAAEAAPQIKKDAKKDDKAAVEKVKEAKKAKKAKPRGPKPAAKIDPKLKTKPIKIKRALKKELKPLVDTLALYIQKDELERSEMRKAKNGVAFLHIAASNTDPNVVVVALKGMSRTWRRKAGRKGNRPVVDKDFQAVVLGRLQDPIPQVRDAAWRAMRLLLGGNRPKPEALKLVLDLVNKGQTPADRVAAISALYNIKDYQLAKPRPGDIKARAISAIIGALESEHPSVVANALHSLNRVSYKKLPKLKKILAALVKLEKHKEQGIRGAALSLGAQLTNDKAGFSAKLQPLLKDEDAFLRSVAASGLGALGNPKAVHALIPLLDDSGKNFTEIRYKGLDGRADKVILRTPGGRQLNEGVLFSLQLLTEGTPYAFSYKSLGGRGRAARRDKAIADAKAWYAKHKASIPK